MDATVIRNKTSDRYRLRALGGIIVIALTLAGLATATASAAPKGTMGPTNAPVQQGTMAPNAPFHTGGHIAELKDYMGHPLVVWQVTTWCPSCRAGLETFARHQAQIDKSDITIIVLRDYKNGGYPGIGIRKFAEQVAPKLVNDPHFVFGEDTKALFDLYNPRHFIDTYEVITPNGHVAVVSSAPSATFDKIESFITPKASP